MNLDELQNIKKQILRMEEVLNTRYAKQESAQKIFKEKTVEYKSGKVSFDHMKELKAQLRAYLAKTGLMELELEKKKEELLEAEKAGLSSLLNRIGMKPEVSIVTPDELDELKEPVKKELAQEEPTLPALPASKVDTDMLLTPFDDLVITPLQIEGAGSDLVQEPRSSEVETKVKAPKKEKSKPRKNKKERAKKEKKKKPKKVKEPVSTEPVSLTYVNHTLFTLGNQVMVGITSSVILGLLAVFIMQANSMLGIITNIVSFGLVLSAVSYIGVHLMNKSLPSVTIQRKITLSILCPVGGMLITLSLISFLLLVLVNVLSGKAFILLPAALILMAIASIYITIYWSSNLYSTAHKNIRWAPVKSFITVAILALAGPALLYLGGSSVISKTASSINNVSFTNKSTENFQEPSDQSAWEIDTGSAIPSE